MKLSKFLLASTNKDENDSQYILHTHHPLALIEVSEQGSADNENSKTYSYRLQNEVLPRRFTLRLARIYERTKNWNTILDEAWRWHVKNVIE